MAQISVGAAVGSGFGLIRRKPFTVLSWGLLQAIALAVLAGCYGYAMLNMFSVVVSSGLQANPNPTPQVVAELVSRMIMSELLIFTAVFVVVIFRVVLAAAVWRAVLHPERGMFAYLRFGAAELLILLMMFAVGFLANFLVLPLLPIMLLTAWLVVEHQWVAAVAVGVIALVLLFALVVYLELRLILIGPMIVDDSKFHFIDTWRLTRGKVGGLFLIGLALVGIGIVVEIVLFIVGGVAVGAGVGLAAGGFSNLMTLAQQPPQAVLMSFAPVLAVLGILAIPVSGALLAIFAAPWSEAYRQLKPPPGAVTPVAAPAPPAPPPEPPSVSPSEPLPVPS